MITVNVDAITKVAAGMGIRTNEELDEYLGTALAEPVTIEIVTAVLKRLPIVFDSAFTIN